LAWAGAFFVAIAGGKPSHRVPGPRRFSNQGLKAKDLVQPTCVESLATLVEYRPWVATASRMADSPFNAKAIRRHGLDQSPSSLKADAQHLFGRF